ncbi:MAG: hypothetical protein Q9209_007562 [Squamulea sp. 1 TL-2023]
MPSPSSSDNFRTPLETLRGLLKGFSDQLSNVNRPSKNNVLNPPNALALLHDSASILRAQGTKLSLLLINKPFTPSAIAAILTSVSGQCLPGLMCVYEICSLEAYGNTTYNEVRNSLRNLVTAVHRLADDIESMAELAEAGADADANEEREDIVGKREDILQVTGQVWNVCDRMIAIANKGIIGVAIDKVKEWEALIKDAIDEIEEWDPDAEDDFNMDGNSDSEVGGSRQVMKEKEDGTNSIKTNGVKHQGNDIKHQSNKQPPSLDSLQITDIHSAKTKALKLLKLIKMLYPALRKRRISTFPPFTRTSSTESLQPRSQVAQFSNMVQFCDDFSTATDDLADALYDGTVSLVQGKMKLMTTMAARCIDGVRKGWDGEEDEFSAWSEKWIARVKEVAVEIPKEELKFYQEFSQRWLRSD